MLQNNNSYPRPKGVRGAVAWGVFAALAVAALVGLGVFLARPPVPAATGDIGTVEVYGQTPDGPKKLPADRRVSLPRPQDLAFQFTSEGTGPRWLRIELDTGGDVSVLYEEQVTAPAFKDSLGYTFRMSEEAPDEVTVIVTLEAPHAMSRVERYPLRLIGADSPFWE